MIFDEADVANLVRLKVGVNQSEVDCPHCGCRFGLVVVNDSSGWLACLVSPEAANVISKTFQEAWNIGVSVHIISEILDKLIAEHKAEAKK